MNSTKLPAIFTRNPQRRRDMDRSTIWNRNYILVLIINILNAFSFNILAPTIPKYVVSIGNGVEIAGFVATAFAITAIITRPFVGYYINLKRKKYMLAAALFIISVCILGYSFSGSIGLIIAFRLLHGVGWGMVTTSSSTIAVLSIPENKIGRGIGLFGIASSLASVFAPNLGLNLIDSVGYFWMFMSSLSLACLGCVLSFFIHEEDLRKAKTPEGKLDVLDRLFAKEALIPAFVILCVGLGMSTISNFIAIYADSLDVKNIGYYFTVAGAVMLVMRPLFGSISDKVNTRKIVLVSLIGYAMVFVTLGSARSLPVFLLAAVLYGTFYGALGPIVQTWCVKETGTSKSGTANSTYYTSLDIGQGVGASLAGLLSVNLGYSRMYYSMIIPQLIAVAVVLCSARAAKAKHRI